MAKTYLLVDAMNLYFRGMHSVSPSAGLDNMIGMAFHIILNSIKKAYKDFDADHVVMCLEGSSFRKSIYPDYKLNRKLDRLKKSDQEIEDGEIMLEAFDEMCAFLAEKTNVSVARCNVAEADDLIALFIQMHPDDNHIIVSSDQDYYQLISNNVKIYNGVDKVTITTEGFFDEKGKPVIDKKTKEPKAPIDPEYFLFKKCIRGDISDNIRSAYPGVREKGTKNKIGIQEAFEDKDGKGYKWNNFMLQRWQDEDDNEHYVKDRYDLNRSLIDLTAQPDDIKVKCIESLMEATSKPPVRAPGMAFMKFCGRWNLKRIGDYANDYMGALSGKYDKESS